LEIKVGNIKYVVNKDKYIIAKVYVSEILDDAIVVQNIIEEDLCPALLRIPNTHKNIIFDTYHNAKIMFGALIFKEGKNINAKIDYKSFDSFVKYTERFSPELLI